MNDDERRAFNAAMSAHWRAVAYDTTGTTEAEAGFLAGIAYAQTWRSMESVPMLKPALLLHKDGRVLHAERDEYEKSWVGKMCGLHYRDNEWEFIGWLPLSPTEAK